MRSLSLCLQRSTVPPASCNEQVPLLMSNHRGQVFQNPAVGKATSVFKSGSNAYFYLVTSTGNLRTVLCNPETGCPISWSVEPF